MKFKFYNQIYQGQVLINGADTITGYNAARALRNTGLSVYGQAENIHSPYCKSNIWMRIYHSSFTIKELKSISNDIKKHEPSRGFNPVLVLSQDDAVTCVLENRKEFYKYYRLQLPESEVALRLMDKTKFHKWALENNILVPRSIIFTDFKSVEERMRSLQFPIIIKPLVRGVKWDEKFPNKKALEINTYNELLKTPDKLKSLNEKMIAQEWIPGGDENIYFVLANINSQGKGEYFCGRKLLQWPPFLGSTAICVGIDDDRLKVLGSTILKRSGLKGLGSIEFKLHAVTSEYYVTEPTVGRNDFQSYIAVASGKNLILNYVLANQGYLYLESNHKCTSMWVDGSGTIRSLLSGKGHYQRLLIAKIYISRLAHFRLHFACFSMSDLRPFVYSMGQLFFDKMRKLFIKTKILPNSKE